MNDFLVLPTGPLADASLAIARSSVNRSILDHSIRSFLFARLLADEEGSLHDADYDEDLLFASTERRGTRVGGRERRSQVGTLDERLRGVDLVANAVRRWLPLRSWSLGEHWPVGRYR